MLIYWRVIVSNYIYMYDICIINAMMPCGSEDLTFLQKVFGSIGNGDESGHEKP
jgi:hypothetical protein